MNKLYWIPILVLILLIVTLIYLNNQEYGVYKGIKLPKSIIESEKYYDSFKPCSFKRDSTEIQLLVDGLLNESPVVRYQSARELILLSNDSIPLLIQNIDRPEFSNASLTSVASFSPDLFVELIHDPILHILRSLTGNNYYNSDRNVEITNWKRWYSENGANLGCDVRTGNVLVLE